MWAWSRLWLWAFSYAHLSIVRNRKSPLPCEGGVAKTLVLDCDSSSLLPYLLDYTQPLQHLSVIAASHQSCHPQLLISFPSLPIFRHSISWLHNVRKLAIQRNTLSTENINNYALHHLNRHTHTHQTNRSSFHFLYTLKTPNLPPQKQPVSWSPLAQTCLTFMSLSIWHVRTPRIWSRAQCAKLQFLVQSSQDSAFFQEGP